MGKDGDLTVLRWQGIKAMETPCLFNLVAHNPKTIASLKFLDGELCKSKLMSETKSTIIVLTEMELGKS